MVDQVIAEAKDLVKQKENETNWSKIFNLFDKMIKNSYKADETLKVLVAAQELLSRSIQSDRTRLSGIAIDFLKKAAIECSGKFNFSPFLSILIKISGKPSKIYVSRALEGFTAIAYGIDLKYLEKFILMHMSSVNKNVRFALYTLIKLRYSENKEMFNGYLEKGLKDQAQEIRAICREISSCKIEEQKPIIEIKKHQILSLTPRKNIKVDRTHEEIKKLESDVIKITRETISKKPIDSKFFEKLSQVKKERQIDIKKTQQEDLTPRKLDKYLDRFRQTMPSRTANADNKFKTTPVAALGNPDLNLNKSEKKDPEYSDPDHDLIQSLKNIKSCNDKQDSPSFNSLLQNFKQTSGFNTPKMNVDSNTCTAKDMFERSKCYMNEKSGECNDLAQQIPSSTLSSKTADNVPINQDIVQLNLGKESIDSNSKPLESSIHTILGKDIVLEKSGELTNTENSIKSEKMTDFSAVSQKEELDANQLHSSKEIYLNDIDNIASGEKICAKANVNTPVAENINKISDIETPDIRVCDLVCKKNSDNNDLLKLPSIDNVEKQLEPTNALTIESENAQSKRNYHDFDFTLHTEPMEFTIDGSEKKMRDKVAKYKNQNSEFSAKEHNLATDIECVFSKSSFIQETVLFKREMDSSTVRDGSVQHHILNADIIDKVLVSEQIIDKSNTADSVADNSLMLENRLECDNSHLSHISKSFANISLELSYVGIRTDACMTPDLVRNSVMLDSASAFNINTSALKEKLNQSFSENLLDEIKNQNNSLESTSEPVDLLNSESQESNTGKEDAIACELLQFNDHVETSVKKNTLDDSDIMIECKLETIGHCNTSELLQTQNNPSLTTDQNCDIQSMSVEQQLVRLSIDGFQPIPDQDKCASTANIGNLSNLQYNQSYFDNKNFNIDNVESFGLANETVFLEKLKQNSKNTSQENDIVIESDSDINQLEDSIIIHSNTKNLQDLDETIVLESVLYENGQLIDRNHVNETVILENIVAEKPKDVFQSSAVSIFSKEIFGNEEEDVTKKSFTLSSRPSFILNVESSIIDNNDISKQI